MNLTTIPRASSITATDANIGSVSTIVINRASTSFTHTVTYSFGSASGTIATKTSETTLPWTIPTSLFQQIPTSQSGTVTLTCQTFSGNTSIGTKTTTMTITVPTSGTYNSFPIIDSATSIDTNSTTIALTGSNTRLVTYKSNVKVSATGRCINYATFNVLRSNNTQITVTTSVSSGTTTVSGNITHNASDKTSFVVFLGDKRGLYTQRTLSQANGDFTVVPYIPLTINASIKRVSPTSSSAYLSFSGNFYNGYYDASNANFNTLTIKWRYKETFPNNGSWSNWTTLTKNTHYKYGSGNTFYSGSGSSQANITLSSVFNYQKSYIVELSCSDSLSTVTVQKPITQGVPIHDEGVDSNDSNYFNINGALYINNELAFPSKTYIEEKNASLSQSVTAGNWQTLGTSYQKHLKVGKYLMILSMSASGSTSGMATLRYTTNNAEEDVTARSSVPISGLLSTAQISQILNITTENDYTFRLQIYSSVAVTATVISLKIIEL